MATPVEKMAERRKRNNNTLKYLEGAATHPLKVIKERKKVGLPVLGERGRTSFFTKGEAAFVEIPHRIEQADRYSFLTSVAGLVSMMGVLKGDKGLTRAGYELIEADVVYTPKTPKARPVDYGLMVTDKQRISNRAGLSVQAVLSMRDVFDYDDPRMFEQSLNGQRLLALFMNGMEDLLDRDIVGDAQRRETWEVASRRFLSLTGASAAVAAPIILKEILDSEPSKASMWLNNLPLLDAIVGAAIGYKKGEIKDRESMIFADNFLDKVKHRIVGTIVGGLVGGGGGLLVDKLAGEDLKLINQGLAKATLTGVGTYVLAKNLYFEPKEKIRGAFESGIQTLKDHQKDVVPFLPSIFHQQGRRRVELYNRAKDSNSVNGLKRQMYWITNQELMDQGFTKDEINEAMKAEIANDRDPDAIGKGLPKIVSSSYARTMYLASMLESMRMLNYDRTGSQKYNLMPVLSPANLRDYVYTHGAAIRNGIDFTKAPESNPTLALGILFPSIWVYNLMDYFIPTSRAQKNEKNLKDAVNFAGRYENTGGTGIKLMSAYEFWQQNWPNIDATNQFQDFYHIVADDLNDTNADSMRNNFSMVLQPPPFYETLNALTTFYLDFTLPEQHQTSERGGVKHIDSMITSLVGQIDKSPRTLMDLLTFISYCKSAKLAKPYLEKLGYNIPIDNGRKFLDVSVKHMEGVVNRTIRILFDKYLANPKGLLTGFVKEINETAQKNAQDVKPEDMTQEKADAVYMQLSALMEWVIRETPEFFESADGRQVLAKLNPDLYERAGVYSAGNVFSGAFIDVFYNVYTVLGNIKEKEGWEIDDPRNLALVKMKGITDKTVFFLLKNTLNVNLNPMHAAGVDPKKLNQYLSDNYTLFEFALNFTNDVNVVEVNNFLMSIIEAIERQPSEYTTDSFQSKDWDERMWKVNTILSSVVQRMIKELTDRGHSPIAQVLAEKARAASSAIRDDQMKKSRSKKMI